MSQPHPDSENLYFAIGGKLRNGVATFMLRLAHTLEARPILTFTLLLAVFVPAELQHSLDKPLWHDELFTLYISQAPHLSDLLREIRLVDLNPPLSYLLTRVSFAVFGVNTLSVRLPEMGGFLLAMLCLFAMVRRRAGTLYGVLAAALLSTGVAQQISVEARPYGLLLGFGALSLYGWQRVRDHRKMGIPLLLAGGFGLLLSHAFGVYVWAAMAAAEAVRVIRDRTVNWPAAFAWIIPLGSLWLYLPLLRAHASALYPPAFQPDATSIFSFYITRSEREFVCLLLTAFAMLLLVGPCALQGGTGWRLTPPEWVSVVLIIASPALLIAQLMYSHAAFFERYGTTASLGISVLAAILLARWTGRDLRAALMCILICLLTEGEIPDAANAIVHGRIFRATEPVPSPCEACARSLQINPSLPFVAASGLTFLEMDHAGDASTVKRLVFLTDPAASRQYAQSSIFNSMQLEKSLFPIRAQVSSYGQFRRQNRDFFVLGDYNYPEDWLLRKLQDDGATLRMMGHFSGPYKDHDLYEVTFDPSREDSAFRQPQPSP